MTTLIDELTVEDLSNAMRARKEADQRYVELLGRAKEEGWSNTKIAGAVGVSEAAIRMYWKRNGKSNYR